MANFPLVYTPENLKYGDEPVWVSATDGDTPTLQLPVRMLGMDAPELHYAGASEKSPSKYDATMEKFLANQGKDLDPGLKKHLASRLVDKPSTRQIAAGRAAFDRFTAIVKQRLDRGQGKTGKPLTPRHIFTMASSDVFDHYGRLLAYVNASYTKDERDKIPAAKRPTFNLQMMQEGHAVSLVIYRNIPKPDDLVLVQQAVKNARTKGKGLWKEGAKALLPYEFRWIADTITGKRSGPDRYCGDITTGLLHRPQHYYEVEPENRLFFFPEHVPVAMSMGLQLV
jgi:endonuclease YncB( thermonuclease family)